MPPLFYPGSRLCFTPTSNAYTYFQSHCASARGHSVFIPPPLAPFTAEKVILAIRAGQGKADVMLAVPLILNLLLQHPEEIEALLAFEEICVSGGQLSPETGNALTSRGIKVHLQVASTESGTMMDSGSARTDDWDALEIPPLAARYLPSNRSTQNPARVSWSSVRDTRVCTCGIERMEATRGEIFSFRIPTERELGSTTRGRTR